MKRHYGGGSSDRILKWTRVRLRPVAVAVAIGLVCAAAASEENENAPATPVTSPQAPPGLHRGWRFELLPRSFQKNPRVAFNVISEMTDAGRRAPQPLPEQPVYYELHISETSDLGGESGGGGRPPSLEYLKQALSHALAENSLLPGAPPENPATVFLVCHWGYYSLLEDDPEFEVANRVRKRKELLDRAVLVGGEKFASEFAGVLEKADAYVESMAAFANPSHPAPGHMPVMGDITPSTDLMNPLEFFIRRDDKTRYLVEESIRPCYFVIVSAYDRQSAMEDKRMLLWRTKMTVNADGLSMPQTMLPLIANTSAFMGKDMSETAIIEKRINREGRVELGPLRIIGWELPAPDISSESPRESNPEVQPEVKSGAPGGRQ